MTRAQDMVPNHAVASADVPAAGCVTAMAGRQRFFSRRRGNAARGDGARRAVPCRSHMRGYTLIEVIVAFGVLALGLTLLLGILSGATRQVRQADVAGRAALHAQSLLDQVGVGEVLQPGVREGEFERGAYRWTLNVAPYQDAASAGQPQAVAEPKLMQLLLTVRWGEDPRRDRLQLRTLRLVAPDVAGGQGIP